MTSTYTNAITAANSTAASASTASSANTLAKLAGNFNDFLSLLTTQLKNQDPTAPLDTNQFTSQLVQFTSVSEQISTNATLGQILTATLSQQLTAASALVGQKVSISGGTLPLQNGAAAVNFQTTSAQPVQVTVSDSAGNTIQSQTINASSGANRWTWDGSNVRGATQPDGPYTVAVTAQEGGPIPFQAVGLVTGADQENQAVHLQFGTTSTTFDKVVSIGG